MKNPEYYHAKPVESLQTMLRYISDADPRILPVIPDGQYGQNTYASVRSFQEAYGLPVTGSADLQTWSAIVSAYDEAFLQLSSPAIVPLWVVGRTLTPGQFNYHLYLVQAMLIALSDSFSNLSAPQVSGLLDEATQEALMTVQKASGIAQTGLLDTETWNHLNGLYHAVITDGEK